MKLNFADFDEKAPAPEVPKEPKQMPSTQTKPHPSLTPHQMMMLKERPSAKETRFYFPGISEGQPYKHDYYRQCYNITKTLKNQKTPVGDKFDFFLNQADQRINYWESSIGRSNPYNPFNMVSEFSITVIDDAAF